MNWDTIISVGWRILAVIVLVAVNGFFVAAEFALVKIRDTQLNSLIARGHRRARVADYILQRLDSFLSAAQLGITLASLGLGWIGEPVFTVLLTRLFNLFDVASPEIRQFAAFGIGLTVITFLHISAG